MSQQFHTKEELVNFLRKENIRGSIDYGLLNVVPTLEALPAPNIVPTVAQVGEEVWRSNINHWINQNGKRYFGHMPGFIMIGDSLQALGNRSGTVSIVATVGQSSATLTMAGHALNIGQLVNVQNTTQPEFNGVFPISGIVDANNFSVALNSPATVETATGSPVCVALNRINDSNQVALANYMAGHKALYLGNFAVGGAQVSQVLERLDHSLNPANNLWNKSPDIVFCSVLTNNTLNDIPIATTKADLETLISRVYAEGKLLVLDNGWPLSSSAVGWSVARVKIHFEVISWLNAKAKTDGRFELLNTFDVVADKANQYANYKSGWSNDGIHKNKVGAYQVAKLIKSQIFDGIMDVDDRVLMQIALNSTLDGATNTVSGTGGSGPVATSWALAANGGGSQTVVGEKGLSLFGVGESQRATITAVAALDRANFQPSAHQAGLVSQGSKYVFRARVRSASLTGAFRYILMAFSSTVSGFTSTHGACEQNGTESWGEDFDMIFECPLWTVPAGLTSFYSLISVAFNGAGSGTFDISDVGVYKVV